MNWARRLGRLVLVLAALLAGLVPAVASAQEAGDQSLVIRKVDTTQFPTVRVSTIVRGDRPDFTDFTVRENGSIVQDIDVQPVGTTDTQVGIVLAIDTSGSMLTNDAFTQAKAAARAFISGRAANERIAIVAFGGRERTVLGFTTDQQKLTAAIDGLGTQRETSLWDGVRLASGMFADFPKMQANVVVLSDGSDTFSQASADDAKAAAIARNVAVFVVGLEGEGFDGDSLRGLATDTGGTYLATGDAAGLDDLYESVQGTIQNQFDIVFQSAATTGPISLTLAAQGMKADAIVNPFTVSQGANTNPTIVEPRDGGFFTTSLGKWMFGFLGFLAVVLLVYAVVSLFTREQSMLDSALRPYSDAPGDRDDDEIESASGSMQVFHKAVALTGDFAERRGILSKVEHKLEEADLALRASEAIFFYIAAVVGLTVLGGALTQSFLFALAGLLVAGLLPIAVLNLKAAARKRQFVTQLPDMLQLLSGSLRAGYSLMQAVEAVSVEVDGPMGRELRRIVTEARLGRPLEESMDDSAERMGSADFGWAVMAIRIQREVGGNLAELLMTVAETMIARERLRREVKALTAEGQISAIVLGILPIGLGLAMYVINRPYIETLFEETVGNFMLGGAILLALVGFWWMKKTIEIEVYVELIAILGLFAALALIFFLVLDQVEEKATVRASLRQLQGYDVENVRDQELLDPLQQRTLQPLLTRLINVGRRFTPIGYVDSTRKKLAAIGTYGEEPIDRFLAMRVVTIAVIPVVFILSFFVLPLEGKMPLAVFGLLTLCLVLGPDAVLNRRVEERQHQIRTRLPDILDLLTISVEAGLGFEQALDRTVAAVPGVLSEEFARMLGEVRAGSSRADAMRAMDERLDVAELRSFVLAILQADTFGVSIGRVLRSQADEMRIKRRQLAQEQAQKAPVKMLIPMVFCIFPALFVVVLGPAVINIYNNF